MIMPIILLTIVSIVWLMIFLYDRTVMYKALVHAVMAADYAGNCSNNELKKIIEDRIDEELGEALLGVENADISVKVSKRKVSASISTTFAVPQNVPVLSELRETEMEIEKVRMSAAELISDVRRIKALYDFAKGFIDDNKETLNKTE